MRHSQSLSRFQRARILCRCRSPKPPVPTLPKGGSADDIRLLPPPGDRKATMHDRLEELCGASRRFWVAPPLTKRAKLGQATQRAPLGSSCATQSDETISEAVRTPSDMTARGMGIGEWGNDKYPTGSMVNLFLLIIQNIKQLIKLSNKSHNQQVTFTNFRYYNIIQYV